MKKKLLLNKYAICFLSCFCLFLLIFVCRFQLRSLVLEFFYGREMKVIRKSVHFLKKGDLEEFKKICTKDAYFLSGNINKRIEMSKYAFKNVDLASMWFTFVDKKKDNLIFIGVCFEKQLDLDIIFELRYQQGKCLIYLLTFSDMWPNQEGRL